MKNIFLFIVILSLLNCMTPSTPEIFDMSERIINGNFTADLDDWANGPGAAHPFYWGGTGVARASGLYFEEAVRHRMYQEFSISHEVISAILNAWINWEFAAGSYVEFWIEIEKPDLTRYQAYHYKWTVSPGPEQACNDLDVTAEMTQQGNYKLDLVCDVYRGSGVVSSNVGEFDNISLDVAIKKTKSIREDIGGTEDLSSFASALKVSVSEEIAVTETVGGDVLDALAIAFKVIDPIVISENIDLDIAMNITVSETVIIIDPPNIVRGPSHKHSEQDNVGLSESLIAKKTSGNVVTTYVITKLTQWDERAAADTDWDKYKVKIIK